MLKKLISSYINSERVSIFGLELFIILNYWMFSAGSVIMLGGLMLILGSKYMNSGNILFSTVCYVVADLCWSLNAYQHNDWFGFLCVNIGILIGLRVLYKMHKGDFVRSLKKVVGI